MTTLQEYLNQKYPTQQDKEKLQDLNLEKISEEREQEGQTDLLEGGELDLTAFKNLVEVEIYGCFMKTPITKLNVAGLTNLKTLIWPDQTGDSEEEKKLWTELGIAELTTENRYKRRTVKEIRRLAELKSVQVYFKKEATEEELNEANKKDKGIFIELDKKDKQGNFCPSLVFWNFAYELSIMDNDKNKTPNFWKKFDEQLEWVKDNLIVLPIEKKKPDFRRDFAFLLTPSTFPTDKLEIKELLTVYYPNSEITDSQIIETAVRKEIADKTWQTIKEKVLDLTDQELKNNPDEEKSKELAFKAQVDYNVNYKMKVWYHPNFPFQNQIRELVSNSPLQLENELLKKEKEELPTPENFKKLQEQNQLLDNELQNLTDEETYQKVKQKLSKIE